MGRRQGCGSILMQAEVFNVRLMTRCVVQKHKLKKNCISEKKEMKGPII